MSVTQNAYYEEILVWLPADSPPGDNTPVLVCREFVLEFAYNQYGSWYSYSPGQIELHDVQWWAKVEGPE